MVLKAGVWYLVAGVDGQPRTYRLSSIRELTPPGDRFERPPDFDLPAYWAEQVRRFETGVYRGTALLRVAPGALGRLRELSPAVAEAAARAAPAPDAGGWVQLAIPIESIDHAARELLSLGADTEVLEPAALRRRMGDLARRLADLYRAGGRWR